MGHNHFGFFRSAGMIPALIFTLLSSTSGQIKDSTQNIVIAGFVDAYYSANIANPESRMNKLRNFDIPANQVNFSLAEISLQKKAEPIGFRFVAGFGTASDVIHGVAPFGTNPYNAMTNIQQAYLTAVLPLGAGLTIDAGEFVTHMGYEVIESKDNWNYSRSLLFAYAIPYYHTGIRFSYPFAGNLTAAVHMVNGWNSVIDNNEEKTLGLTLNYTPASSMGIILNVIDGFEQPSGFDVGKKTVYDLIVSEQASDDFSLALNADYGSEMLASGLQVWKGAALYGRYVFGPRTAIGLRAEVFDDPQGYATGFGISGLTVKELTGTYEYQFAKALLFRGEARYDFSNADVFDKKTGVDTQSGQLTFLAGLVATF